MVWFYGGAFSIGSISEQRYNGAVLVAVGDVIVVTVNYRLGSLGFLFLGTDDASGNMGELDQQLALQWVHDNIHAFGGDSKRVTIFGQGFGAVSVGQHTVVASSQSLFQNAIMESGSTVADWGYDTAAVSKNKSLALAAAVGCDRFTKNNNMAVIAECLRTIDSFRFYPQSTAIICSTFPEIW